MIFCSDYIYSQKMIFMFFFLIACKASVFYYAFYFKLFWLVGTTHAQTTTFPPLFFLQKRVLLLAKSKIFSSQYNDLRSAICHNLFLFTFLLFGPIYRRNKSDRLKVRFRVDFDHTLKFTLILHIIRDSSI